jgi:hypothetical protein
MQFRDRSLVPNACLLILFCNLAQVEELALIATKEEAIEGKIAAISGRWAVAILTFADYKSRGLVALKVNC